MKWKKINKKYNIIKHKKYKNKILFHKNGTAMESL